MNQLSRHRSIAFYSFRNKRYMWTSVTMIWKQRGLQHTQYIMHKQLRLLVGAKEYAPCGTNEVTGIVYDSFTKLCVPLKIG